MKWKKQLNNSKANTKSNTDNKIPSFIRLILYNLISCSEICKPGYKLWSGWIHFTKFYIRRDESTESEWERVIWLAIFSGVTVKDRGRVNLRSSVPKELGAKLWNVKWPKEALQKKVLNNFTKSFSCLRFSEVYVLILFFLST